MAVVKKSISRLGFPFQVVDQLFVFTFERGLRTEKDRRFGLEGKQRFFVTFTLLPELQSELLRRKGERLLIPLHTYLPQFLIRF